MRALALLAALLLPVLAHGQGAGPLADRVVATLRIDLAAGSANAMADSMATMAASAPTTDFVAFGPLAGAMRIDAPVLADSIRAALADAGRPELLAQALVYLESPEAGRLQEAMPLMPGTSPLDLIAARDGAVDGTLADSALTARILRAATEAAADPALMLEMMERAVELIADAVPPADLGEMRAQLDEMAAVVDDPMVAQMQEMQLAFMVPLYRALFGGLPDEDLRAGAAYYESDAGRHVTVSIVRGMMRYQIPRLAGAIGAMAGSPEADDAPPAREH